MANLEQTAISRTRTPDLIPGYRLEKVVGKGGMGEVYRAVQLSLGRVVAVKVLASDLARDSSFVARFDKEGAALASLSHPNIVSIVDKGKSGETCYLVMEFVDGPSLRETMRSPSHDAASALRRMIEICRAIDYAHQKGVIHRDLKPENILFDEQAGGIAKVTDFGLAGFVHAGAARFNVTDTHVSMGTLTYMAPEQRVDAKTADHRADLYSLGVMLYELLVGEVPVGTFAPPSQAKPGLDPRLDPIVARCLKPAPAERYPSVASLLEALEPLAPTTQPPPRLPTTAMARLRWRAREAGQRLLRWAAVGLVAVAALVVGLTWLRSGQRPERPSAGIELTTDFPSRWPLTASGRVDPNPFERSFALGEGPDTLPVIAYGRRPTLATGEVLFPRGGRQERVGRATLDPELTGDALVLSADVLAESTRTGRLAAATNFLLGPPPEPRAALILSGEPGRYVALILSGGDAPPMLEWALGNAKRGTMSTPNAWSKARTRLELAVNESGELVAALGSGRDRRPLGDPLSLGPEWRKLLGARPRASVGCLDAVCRFGRVSLVLHTTPPPEPPPSPVLAEAPAAPVPHTTTRSTSRTLSRPPSKASGAKKSAARCDRSNAFCRVVNKVLPKRR